MRTGRGARRALAVAASALLWGGCARGAGTDGLAPEDAQGADADTDIVVTASGIAQNRDESGQAITIIGAATIERRQEPSVAGLLATTPSVRVNSNGSLGSVTSVSLRGAEAGQTLVLIDGVRVNDPSSTSDAVDFGNLLVGNIRRIEIMRGSNAIPYGSEAIGGVINLSTRDPDAPDGLSLRGSAEAGADATGRLTADAGWRRGGWRIDGGVSALRTDGISSAAARFGATEPDGLANATANLRIEAPLAPGVTLDLRGYAIDARLDYDSFFGTPADSADSSHFRQLTLYAGLQATSLGGRLESSLSLTRLGNSRDYRLMPGTPPDFGYRGGAWRAEYRGLIRLMPAARLLLGYAHDAPDYRFFGFGSDERHSASTDSVYGLAMLRPAAGLAVTAGLRHDAHSRFGGVTTLGANANWAPGEGTTHLRLAYGEGFRAPSLYQLYDSFSGNAGLRPERSHGFDLGIDRSIAGGRVRLALTLFARTTREQIDYDFASARYANLARTLARGVELAVDADIDKETSIALSYSLVDTRDRSPGSPSLDQHLPRRPVNSASLSLDRQWSGGISTGLTLRGAGDSRDPAAPDGRLPGYVLLDLRAGLALGRHAALFARLDNATNTRYETSYGYSTHSRAAYGGIRLRW